jgi:dipeptidyl aminopeptidase/acylaminoacyl peptidase
MNAKNKIVLLIVLLASSFVCVAEVKETFIPVEDLFQSPDIYSYKFNPSSEYIAKHYSRGEDYNVIEILDVNTGKVADAFRIKLKNNNYAYIKDYQWIDNNTLYISYRLGKKTHKRIFLDLDYAVFKASDDEISTIRRIESKARIIDPLIYQDNEILVGTYNNGEAVEVYTTTTEGLQNDKFKESERFKKNHESALGYFSGDNGKIQFTASIENEKLKFYYLKDYQSEWVELFEFGEFDFDFEPVAFLGNNKMVVITNKDTDKKSLVEFDYSTKTFEKVLYQHDKYDLVGASVSGDSGEVTSVTYFDHGHLKTDYFSKSDKKIDNLVKKKLPGKQYIILSKHKNSPKMILFVFSANDPGTYYWLNASTGEINLLGPSHSYLEKYQFSKTEIFLVASENDKSINIEAILTLPKISNGVLLVEPHGGPIGVRHLDIYNRSNQFYASRGYTILNVNFRGSSGYGKKFLSEGRGQFGKRIEQDISLAVKKVKEKYSFKSTCTMGASYGGYSALMLAAYHPKEYECVVGAYGVYDLPLLFNSSNMKMGEKHIKSVTNTVGDNQESLKDYSPVYFAEKIKAPVLLIAGIDDSIAGFEQSNRMKYRLKQLGSDLEYMFYEDTGHGHENYYWEMHEHLLIDDFIKRKLNLTNIAPNDSVNKGNEAMRLADPLAFDDKVEDNSEKAFQYYQKAAENKNPRGYYNLASFYHRGELVDKDMNKAVDLYKKSSEVGYDSASYRLGEMYQEGTLISKDLEQSHKYFELALNQGHEKASDELNRINCLALGVDKNDEKCIKHIVENIKEKEMTMITLIRDMIFDTALNTKELSRLVDTLADAGFKSIISDMQFYVEQYGLFEFNSYRRKYIHQQSEGKIEIAGDKRIGIEYTISHNEIKNSDNKRSNFGIFKTIWHHPPFKVDKTDKTEDEKLTVESLNWGTLNRNHLLFYKFDSESEKVSGEWALEIQSLDGRTLFHQTFDLIF